MVKFIQKSFYIALFLAGILVLVADTYADGDTTDFSITVNPSLSLSVSSSTVGFEITPTQTGAYNSSSFDVYSSTNNATGYTLTMSTSKVNLESNTVNPNIGTNPTIPTLTETQDGITAAAFEASTSSDVLNHYGVSIAGANYNAMKSTQEIKKTTENNTTQDTTAIALASKLDLLTVPGVYSTTINFQMTANPLPDTLESAYAKASKQKTTIGGQQYYSMQDMNSTICADVDIDDGQLQVYDNRDNKIYWIAKLRDGNCWMTQNLDLDLIHMANDADALYTHENTDLGWGGDANTTTWNPEHSTVPVTDISAAGYISGWADSYTDPYSVDTGDWYWTNVWYDSMDCYDSQSNELCNYLTGNVAGKFSQSPFSNGTHGHVGNHYNWVAAIASNDLSNYDYTVSGNPQNSICPAGWRLPTISNVGDVGSSNNEFQGIVSLYNNNTSNDKGLTASPLYFIRGGFVGSNNLYSSGYGGSYLSDTPYLEESINYLYLYSNYVDPEDYSGWSDGHSVRCIAR